MPTLSIPKTVFLLLHRPDGYALPDTLNPILNTIHPPTGFRLAHHDRVSRSLGVPFSSNFKDSIDDAYSTMAPRMSAAAQRWTDLDPCLWGRVHAANQCIASKAVYQQGFLPPHPIRHSLPMQRAVQRLAASTRRAEEATPFPHALYPGQQYAFLPRREGGLGLLDMQAASLAMLAKPIWQLFTYSSHPSRILLRHEVSSSLISDTPPVPPSHPPDIPPGAHWMVTLPSLVPPRPCPTPSYQASLEAFRKLGINRIVAPCSQSLDSILLELTFNNTAPESTPILPSDISSAMARTWLRLRAVHAAFLRRAFLPPDAKQDLLFILGCLPPAWLDAITSIAPPAQNPWSAVSHPDDPLQLFLGPDVNYGDATSTRLWELWPNGRLHPFDGAFVAPDPALFPPRSTLVKLAPWDRRFWLRREWERQEEQAELPPQDRTDLVEPWLVGIYDSMDLDPSVWGLSFGRNDNVSLIDIQVSHARRSFTRKNSLARAAHSSTKIPGYAAMGAAWPAIWPLDTSPAAPSPVLASDDHLRLLGLDGIEERWRRVSAKRALAAQQLQDGQGNDLEAGPIPINTPPAWLDLGPRPPRLSRQQRRALRGNLPAPDLRREFPSVWRPLLDPTIHPPFAITAWRILHGCIGCNAFLGHVRHRHGPFDPSFASCAAPTCSTAHVAEDITHAFFSCPEVQPAVTWMFDTWQHLSGLTVPRLTRVFLADDPHLWPGKPADPALLRLWQFLRVTTIGAIWRIRCSRSGRLHQGSFARRVALLVVDSVNSAISRDWARTHADVRKLDDGQFCTDWWRGFDAQIPVSKFIDTWAAPEIFCRVVGAEPAGPNDADTRTLTLLLSRSAPLALPP